MMLTLFKLVCYILAAYGMVSLLISMYNMMHRRLSGDMSGIKVVLIVKNEAERIEGIIRYIFMWEILKRGKCNPVLTVIDMDSADETKGILTKLSNDYGALEVLDYTEREKAFSSFKKPKDSEL